jgi:hypothetical protein
MPLLPWIDPENFNPGHVMRGMHLLPKRATSPSGSTSRATGARRIQLPAVDLDDAAFVYEWEAAPSPGEPTCKSSRASRSCS